jgi:hypothetical protein
MPLPRKRWLALGAALIGAAVASISAPTPEPSETRSAGIHAEAPAPRPTRADLARLLLVASQTVEPDAAHERPSDGRPHPITLDHMRLYRDVDLLRSADSAIRAGRYDDARALVAQHHRELPGMSALEEEGLLLLADCAERPSAANVARVRRFYDEHTDSTLRRRLRRACLEAEGPRRAAVQ